MEMDIPANLNGYEEKKREFLERLGSFLNSCGKRPSGKPPIMGYKELDLYSLYNEVVEHGGYHTVVRNVGTWSKIWKRLPNYDSSITDSSYRLKKNYERFLLDFEYHCCPQHKEEATHFQRQNYERHSDFLFEIINPCRNAKRKIDLAPPMEDEYDEFDSTDPEFRPGNEVNRKSKKTKSIVTQDVIIDDILEESKKRSRRYSLCTQEELSAVVLLQNLKYCSLEAVTC
jgi:AT-rich interactive domain-containing protein 4A